MTDVQVTAQWVEAIQNSTATPAVTVTAQWVEAIQNSTATPAVTVTAQWVEAIQNSTAAPAVTVTAQWVEAIQNSTATPAVTVTSQWVEYIYSAAPPVEVHVTSQWVEFLGKMPNYAKATQEYAEIINKPTTVALAVTQEYGETLSKPSALKAAVTQEYIESISQRINGLFSTQVYGEVIGAIWTSIFPARTTEIYAEVLTPTGVFTRVRASSIFGEVIRKTDTGERITSEIAEVHYKPAVVNAAVTSNFLEVISRTRGFSKSININVN